MKDNRAVSQDIIYEVEGLSPQIVNIQAGVQADFQVDELPSMVVVMRKDMVWAVTMALKVMAGEALQRFRF